MKKNLTAKDYYEGVISGNRILLAKAITLIESNADKHRDMAQQLLHKILPHSGNSLRIGITGAPGVGKSTFIDIFGSQLISEGHKVAVLTIDPSSTISGGSILGDKTRMEKLSAMEECFIRPSSSNGVLGGVAAKTRESILLCESAGYDIIIVETVGVGQNELTVHSMVDFFMLMQIAGGGDELQGIKRGIIELADIIVVNKADGDNFNNVVNTINIFKRALDLLHSVNNGWKREIAACSALKGTGINEIWYIIKKFRKLCTENGEFNKRREQQRLDWFDILLYEEIKKRFFERKDIENQYSKLKDDVKKRNITVVQAVEVLINELWNKIAHRT